jgi:8-oxo-dGTP pyrophosphatase MutT (NUDIX family)
MYKGRLYFLFGKENSLADTPGWSDFGGGVDKGEQIYESALREGGEELTGFLGDAKQIESLIKKNGGHMHLLHGQPDSGYHVHIFRLPYSEELVQHFNNNHQFLWKKMNKKFLNDTKLFEKIEIKWFSVDEMRRKKSEFRSFYQEVIDMLLKHEADIKRFIATNKFPPIIASSLVRNPPQMSQSPT